MIHVRRTQTFQMALSTIELRIFIAGRRKNDRQRFVRLWILFVFIFVFVLVGQIPQPNRFFSQPTDVQSRGSEENQREKSENADRNQHGEQRFEVVQKTSKRTTFDGREKVFFEERETNILLLMYCSREMATLIPQMMKEMP